MSARDAFTVLLAHRTEAGRCAADANLACNLARIDGASARKLAGLRRQAETAEAVYAALDAAIEDYLGPVETSTDTQS